MFTKTKIIATIGPASESKIQQLIESGVSVFRLNFSHGDHELQKRRYELIRKISRKNDRFIGVMQDLQGAKIRIGKFKNGQIELKEGKKFILTTNEIIGTEKIVTVDYKELPKFILKNDLIYIDDGKVKLFVERITSDEIHCEVLLGGVISDRKGVIIPKKRLNLPGLTKQDIKDILFGVKLGIDYIAQSFVRKPQQIVRIKEILKKENAEHIQVIAKIEDDEGVENIDKIIDVSDGVMIARGDMGVCFERAEVPIIQQMIIDKSNIAGKLVIVATQMLDSMTQNPFPTRAEVSDVANAVIQGADCLLLSSETAVGKYPVESVKEMMRIIETVEKNIDYDEFLMKKSIKPEKEDICQVISYAVRELADKLNAKAIVTATLRGKTPITISKFRPKTPIFAFTPDKETTEKLSICWGITPLFTKKIKKPKEEYPKLIKILKELGIVKQKDKIVFTSGVEPFSSYITICEV